MASAPEPVLDELVRQAARSSEPDRYLSALLAPNAARADLIALAAFAGEVARISRLVNEPMMGEMRLQWWRDVLEAGANEGAAQSPVAEAICRTAARHDLSGEAFLDLLEAHGQELWPGFPPTGSELERYLDRSEGSLLRLTARVLKVPASRATGDLISAAAQAYGRVRLLLLLPGLIAKGHAVLPPGAGDWGDVTAGITGDARDWLAKTRAQLANAPRALLPALLPVALVEPYLKVFEGVGPGAARQPADISPLTRVWKLWLANMRGRV